MHRLRGLAVPLVLRRRLAVPASARSVQRAQIVVCRNVPTSAETRPATVRTWTDLGRVRPHREGTR